jgi:hypothetical protein
MSTNDASSPTADCGKRECACGKPLAFGGIRQSRNGKCDWTIHDLFECYRVVRGVKKLLARK